MNPVTIAINTRTQVVLTDRQYEIYLLIKKRLTNREIAKLLIISERTVETHVTALLQKLGFTNRIKMRLLCEDNVDVTTKSLLSNGTKERDRLHKKMA